MRPTNWMTDAEAAISLVFVCVWLTEMPMRVSDVPVSSFTKSVVNALLPKVEFAMKVESRLSELPSTTIFAVILP